MKIVTTVVTIVATLVTIVTSVPVTTLSMLSTSFETRFMISPVLVFGEERERHVMQVRDELRADVPHDPFADHRVQVALVDADRRRDQRRRHHPADVEPQKPLVVMRERNVDQILGEQRGRQSEDGAYSDANEHLRFLRPIGKEQRGDAPPLYGALRAFLIGIERAAPHQVHRPAATHHRSVTPASTTRRAV